jgi:predicted peptidase
MVGHLALVAGMVLAAPGDAGKSPKPRFNCIVYVPKAYKKVKKNWPLIMYLHGRSLRGKDLKLVKKYGLPARLEKNRNFPFITLCPQCPPDERWTDTKGLKQLLDHICKAYPVDRTRMYVMGFSMGASGAWRMGYEYPELFSAIVPIAGMAEPVWVKSGKMRKVAVWGLHGDADKDAPYQNTVQMLKLHGQKGGEAVLSILKGRDHSIPDVFDRHDVYHWLLGHSRPGLKSLRGTRSKS